MGFSKTNILRGLRETKFGDEESSAKVNTGLWEFKVGSSTQRSLLAI
jgi:hypothetical protein